MGVLIFLAFLQSLTEFLPISSSGHLLLSNLFGLSDQGIVVDIALHIGTLLAVMLYFRKDIVRMILLKDIHLLSKLIVGTVPIVVVGAVIHFCDISLLRGATVIGLSSIFFGWLLWKVDEKAPCSRRLQQMSFVDAFLIGVAQVLSVIPGTSRSGITMTCARWRGFKREESARFAMLLSIPTILLAGIYTIWKASSGQMIMPPNHELAVALVSSAIFGMIAITFLIKWLNKASFFVFGVYRIILGICVLIYFL